MTDTEIRLLAALVQLDQVTTDRDRWRAVARTHYTSLQRVQQECERLRYDLRQTGRSLWSRVHGR